MPRSPVIELNPKVLRCARERAGLTPGRLGTRMGVTPIRVLEWERNGQISMRQADSLAQKTYTPLGYLYLSKPPTERLPIKDFRKASSPSGRRPSPNLLDTVYAMQLRQVWLRDEFVEDGCEPLPYVASVRLSDNPDDVANSIRDVLGLESSWNRSESNWRSALRNLQTCVDRAGIFITLNGIVGNNTRRKLDPYEFRGFALVDDLVPMIFVNNSDYVAAQMFTIIHEIAHIFLGESGVSCPDNMGDDPQKTELFCNQVAAEFLVPRLDLMSLWHQYRKQHNRFDAIASELKVSSIVVARHAFQMDLVGRNEFFTWYNNWKGSEEKRKTRKIGGNFWNSQSLQVGDRFGLAVARAVLEGRMLYRQAYSLTGLYGRTFDAMLQRLEPQLRGTS